ncbi:MAG: type II toxin-antitoxin system ParD family antitoxin [Cohaesibacter sp.]|nr:type II toxin-antitoxin system ParD family antitoxin [Cohaesibacter sp.]MCV6602021.1 type II toxin-antitoxin system ParD family antitoxin [Cohaesibacter sp.]
MASSSRTIAIGDYFERFVAEQVSSGRFNNSSEVMRAGLRMLEEHELGLREQKSIIRLKETDAKLNMADQAQKISTEAAAKVTNSVQDAMQALAASELTKSAVAIPATKCQLRARIAAE